MDVTEIHEDLQALEDVLGDRVDVHGLVIPCFNDKLDHMRKDNLAKITGGFI